ncbi:MAG: zinc ribbon domain-containing protein [Pyrinomonadaceae bacterium]|nr:zinc ribbon domain-containing protein [Pyrinomonadaceae bacterium]
MICSKCGAEIRDGALYCYGCGKAVAETSVPAGDDASVQAPEEMTDLELAHSSAVAKSASEGRGARRRTKSVEPKVVEVVWEEPKNGTTVFIVASLILVVLGFLLVAAGLYLK